MFWKKRGSEKRRVEQYDKMMTGYGFATGDIERIIAKLDELPDSGLPIIKFGREPLTLKELRQRFADYLEKIPVSKAAIVENTANYRILANEMDRVAKDIAKTRRELKLKMTEPEVGCLFLWAVLDTQADRDEGLPLVTHR